ncbi:MAG TPA: tetratricopeptide repeat protein [Vicinamibacterales bacterium]|nr:tetratricopeptide repeat protein [Vicinamibacterales bacterium]
MTRLATLVMLSALLAANAAAQPRVPDRGLAAEGEGRWSEALEIYRAELARDPASAGLWLRVADIEARLGRPGHAIAALERAAKEAPAATTFERLSQAYAAAGHPLAAVRTIEAALALQPDHEPYLRSHAQLATWAGDYAAAEWSYRTLRRQYPGDAELTLALARVCVWGGSTDAAVSSYREYLAQPQAAPGVWLELARAESWRGNFAVALETLERYRQIAGETREYMRERAGTLARGGRPGEALRYIEALLPATPGDYELNLSRTIALARLRRQGDAYSSLTAVDALTPGRAETRATAGVLRSLLASNAGLPATFYSDSDGLRAFRATPKFDIGFSTDTRVHGGYEMVELRARASSGLEQLSGATTASVDHAWAGVTQRIGLLTVAGTIGQADTGADSMTTYSALARFATDTVAASAERSSGFFTISPRTVGLGLTRVGHRLQLDWNPALRYHLVLDASHEDLSDGNVRWEVFVSPRVEVARRQRFNLDLGVLVHQFGARHDFSNGYYDPDRYEYYSAVVSPYWKASERVGVAISAGIGGQRDDASRDFRLGTNASAEATFGIYDAWVLKVNGSVTNNRRLESGAFSGSSGGIVLVKRF